MFLHVFHAWKITYAKWSLWSSLCFFANFWPQISLLQSYYLCEAICATMCFYTLHTSKIVSIEKKILFENLYVHYVYPHSSSLNKEFWVLWSLCFNFWFLWNLWLLFCVAFEWSSFIS
jgi:hypothetical protein